MTNTDLYILLYCDDDIRSSLDELSEGGKLSGKGELRLQAACAVAAELINFQGATNLPGFRELYGAGMLAHEAGHLLVAIDKALKAESSRREKLPAVSWGGAAAMDLAINSNLNLPPGTLVKAAPMPVDAESALNLVLTQPEGNRLCFIDMETPRMAAFPPPGFQDRLRTLAASVSGPLVPAELALPAFREAVYALAIELPQFLLPGDFNDLDEASLRHVGHLVVVYGCLCLRQWGNKEDRQVAAVCESIANKRFPKL